MTLLRRRVLYQIGESATSYASRLAARNGTVLSLFCAHMGISQTGIVNGSDMALGALEALSGVNAAVLRFETVRKTDDATWSIRGQSLNVPTVRRGRPWFCPLCAKDDLADGPGPEEQRAYGRAAWNLVPLRTCHVHDVALVEIAVVGGDGAHYDFAHTFASARSRFDEVVAQVITRRPSGLEKYLHRRLATGTGDLAWFDGLPFHVVALMVERVGAVANLGRKFDAGALSDDERWQAGSKGFELLQGGPTGLTDFLVKLKSSYEFGLSGLAGPRALYGKLWQWLEKGCPGPEFNPVRDIVREHVLRTTPVASGTEVLGQILEQRKLHSIRSASLEYGRHPARLRALLVAHGIVSKDSASEHDAHVTFSADDAESFLNGVSTAMSAAEVKRYLNIRHIEAFVQGGALTPIAAILDARDAKLEFMRSDVEFFLQSLIVKSTLVSQKVVGTVGVYEASKKAKCTVVTILNLIASGRLSWVGRVESIVGLESFLVIPAEVKGFLARVDCEHIAEHQLTKRLGVNRTAVCALIDHGILGNVADTLVAQNNRKRVLRLDEVVAFEQTYVSLFRLAGERKLHARAVKKSLAERSIYPALQAETYHATFYLRSAV